MKIEVEEEALNKIQYLVQELTTSFENLERESKVMRELCVRLEQERDAYKDMLDALQATFGDKK